MKKKLWIIIAAAACVALVLGGYYFFVKSSPSVEDAAELTEVQKITTKMLEKDYPNTPREVVKLYNRIIKCFYNDTYTDEEFYALGDQARLLFDEELLENNPRDAYFSTLKSDIENYHEQQKVIMSTNVCDSNEVNFQTVDGAECAYVEASYFIEEGKKYNRTYQTYVLRKDEQERWKILVYYRTEGEDSDE